MQDGSRHADTPAAKDVAAPSAHQALVEAQRKAQNELEIASVLLQTADTLASWADLPTAFAQLADILLRSTEQGRVTVNLWDETRQELSTVASKGRAAMAPATFPISVLSPQIREVISARKSIVFDYDAMAQGKTRELVAERAIHLGLIVPIVYRERVLGLIGVDSPGQRLEFTQREIELVEGIASQAAGAIENGRLYDDVRRSNERLTRTLNSIGDAFLAVDHDWRLTFVNPEAARLLQLTTGQLLGHDLWEMFPEAEGSQFYTELHRALESGESVSFEEYYPPLDLWAGVRAYSSPDGLSIYFRDVSERRVAEEALRQSRERTDMLANLIENSSQPFMVGAPDGSLLMFNRAFEELTGRTADELKRATWPEELVAPEYLELEREVLVQVAETSLPRRYEKELLRKDGKRVPVEVLRHFNRDMKGNGYFYGFYTDIAERKERDRLNEAFNAISKTVTASLDFDEIMHRLVELSAEALGVDTANATMREGDHWVVKAVWGIPGSVVGVRLTSQQIRGALLAIEEHRPIAINDTEADSRVNIELARQNGVRSFLAVPLSVQGREIGVATFNNTSEARTFTAAQLDFATKLCGIAALALENATLYEREHNIADTLQKAILTPPPRIIGLDVAHLYRPASTAANVGGDVFDVFELDAERTSVLIADVSGKGLEAARFTSLVRDGARAYALEYGDPGVVLERLNSLIHRSSPASSFATAFFGVLNVWSGKFTFCGAGHPPAVVLRGDRVDLLNSRAGLLGAFQSGDFLQEETLLARGDVLVLYTDGLVEARQGSEMFGEERLVAAITALRGTACAEMPQKILDAVLEFSAGRLRDDTIILCLNRPDVGGEVATRWTARVRSADGAAPFPQERYQ